MEVLIFYSNWLCRKKEIWTSNLINTENQWVSSAIVKVFLLCKYQKVKRKSWKLGVEPQGSWVVDLCFKWCPSSACSECQTPYRWAHTKSTYAIEYKQILKRVTSSWQWDLQSSRLDIKNFSKFDPHKFPNTRNPKPD